MLLLAAASTPELPERFRSGAVSMVTSGGSELRLPVLLLWHSVLLLLAVVAVVVAVAQTADSVLVDGNLETLDSPGAAHRQPGSKC